jgi:Ca2+-transporting ATPase
LTGNPESNKQFGWIAAGTVVVLGVVMSVPVISRLFSFAAPPPAMLLAALGAAVLSMVWFEGVKRVQSRRTEHADGEPHGPSFRPHQDPGRRR